MIELKLGKKFPMLRLVKFKNFIGAFIATVPFKLANSISSKNYKSIPDMYLIKRMEQRYDENVLSQLSISIPRKYRKPTGIEFLRENGIKTFDDIWKEFTLARMKHSKKSLAVRNSVSNFIQILYKSV